jgi:hypothetical protein
MPLALVTPLPHEHPSGNPRPWRTHYYSSPRDDVEAWCAVGRAASRRGAILAATRRLIDGRAAYVLIHGIDGAVEVRISLSKGKITILGVF